MKHYKIKSGLFERHRDLMFTPDYVKFENKNLIGDEFTTLSKEDIKDFKHGRDSIQWYHFTVGQQFSITFKDTKNKELKIVFKNYFGRNKEFHQIYSDIVDDIWEFYHNAIVNEYLEKFHTQNELVIQGLRLTPAGIELPGQNSILTWEHATMKDYYSYFAVFDKNNPNLHARISFNEYDAEIFWGVLKTLFKEKGVRNPKDDA